MPGEGAPLIAAVELGGTKCVVMLARGPEAVLERVQILTTTPEETLGAIERAIDGWRDFAALGIASFGPISIDRSSGDYGRITSTPKPHWAHVDVARRLARRYGVPTGFHTDVTGAALGEAAWGAAEGLGDLAYVTVGTGVGVGMIAHGRPVDGLTHAELGHIRPPRLPGDSWGGACPFHGDCVEGLVAGGSLAARTGRKGDAIDADDPVWDSVADAIGHLIATLVLTGVPRRVVFGGGVMLGNPFLLPRVRAAATRALGGYVALPEVADMETFVVLAALGADAGPLGAVLLGRQALSEHHATAR